MKERNSRYGCSASTGHTSRGPLLLALACAMPAWADAYAAMSSSSLRATAFLPRCRSSVAHAPKKSVSGLSMIYAPPGSGWARPEDERSTVPDTYEPMMEYPGTMRPGRTPENIPFHDLPLDDNDGVRDPVPWPHFQQIEWHHRWAPPHPNPISIEDFIEQEGRWATPELVAAMRAGARRGLINQKELEESQKRSTVIVDDDDDDPEETQDLGEGMFGQLGSSETEAITAAVTSPDAETRSQAAAPVDTTSATEDESIEDLGLDDFLLDLGLDSDDATEPVVGDTETDEYSAPSMSKAKIAPLEDFGAIEDEVLDETAPEIGPDNTGTASIDVEEEDLDLGEEDGGDGDATIPLDGFGDEEETFDSENFFDDGGFDFDDADFDMDGGDMW